MWTIELMPERMYEKFGINNKTDFSRLRPVDYPILSDLYKVMEDAYQQKGLLQASGNVKNAMLFNVLSYLSDKLLTEGNTVASIDELYLFLSNPTTIEYIRNFMNGDRLTLEQECLRSGTLPALAYGYKKCSLNHKIGPQDKFCNNYPPCREVWARGEKVVKYIGYDAGDVSASRTHAGTLLSCGGGWPWTVVMKLRR